MKIAKQIAMDLKDEMARDLLDLHPSETTSNIPTWMWDLIEKLISNGWTKPEGL